MASNTFGTIFKITTWGESHGKAIGVVIDGCPAGIAIDDKDINAALALRAPGKSPYTSPRKEQDLAEILSGVFEGKTTGAPISIIIPNKDADSSKYEPIKDLLRPGHANYSYLEKYGCFDYRGGGRASARETACRVAAGAIAKKFLLHSGIETIAYIKQIGRIEAVVEIEDIAKDKPKVKEALWQKKLPCPDDQACMAMSAVIEECKDQGDSIGGAIEFVVTGLPCGLGDPVYEKLEAKLASAMMSLPATKGFEIGSGFNSVEMQGSEHNDAFVLSSDDSIKLQSNFSGGTLGGISTGMPLVGKVAFKPTSSIMKPQKTLTTAKEASVFALTEGSRHDPCVAVRAVVVVEAMVDLVLADAMLLNRCVKL